MQIKNSFKFEKYDKGTLNLKPETKNVKQFINMERHNLLHEFPEHQDKIHQLKVSDPHFRALFDEYHELEHEIHRINMGEEVVIDEEMNSVLNHKEYFLNKASISSFKTVYLCVWDMKNNHYEINNPKIVKVNMGDNPPSISFI